MCAHVYVYVCMCLYVWVCTCLDMCVVGEGHVFGTFSCCGLVLVLRPVEPYVAD
jgi:hypothetical protein